MAYLESICVHGHTLLIDCETERGIQLQKLQDEEVDCVDAVPAEECEACGTQSLISSMNHVMAAEGDI